MTPPEVITEIRYIGKSTPYSENVTLDDWEDAMFERDRGSFVSIEIDITTFVSDNTISNTITIYDLEQDKTEGNKR